LKICFRFRFVYGQVQLNDFKSVPFGSQLYIFAHLYLLHKGQIMDSQVPHQQNAQGDQQANWPRRRGLQLNLLPAFESGDFYDCTIRVGCDLKNSKSSFKVVNVNEEI